MENYGIVLFNFVISLYRLHDLGKIRRWPLTVFYLSDPRDFGVLMGVSLIKGGLNSCVPL